MRYEATPMEKAKNYAAELALGPVQDLKLELCESAIYTCLGAFEREIRPDMLLFHVLLELTNPKNSGEEFEKFKMCLLADHDNVPSSLMAGIMDVLFATRYDSATDPIVYKTFERIFDYRKINGDSIGLYEFSQVNRLVNDTEYGRIIENYIQSCFETGFENGTMAYTLVAATVHMNKNNYGYQWLSFIPSYDESFVRIQNGTEMSQTLLLDVAGLYMMAAYLSKYKVFRLHAERFLVMSKKIIKRLERFLEIPDLHYYNYVFECLNEILQLATLRGFELEVLPDFSRREIVASAYKALEIPELKYSAEKVLSLAGVTI